VAANACSKVAVFDWGGGTLDVSVVEIHGRQVRELAARSETLGGDNIDLKLAKYAHGQIAQKHRLDVPFEAMDSITRDSLSVRVEVAKCRLANESTVDVNLLHYGKLNDVSCEFTAQTLRQLLLPEYEQALRLLEDTVNRAGASFAETGVRMVGGSSKLRGLVDFFREQCAGIHILDRPADADWNIAQGAALVSATPGQHVIVRGLGLVASDGSYHPLFRAGDGVNDKPIEQHFGLVEDCREARFVFAQPRGGGDGSGGPSNHERVGVPLVVPAYGFSDEPITLKLSISPDHVVEVEGRSQRREHEQPIQWTFENLNLSYELPNNL
jgi:molecular chaperone DnaK